MDRNKERVMVRDAGFDVVCWEMLGKKKMDTWIIKAYNQMEWNYLNF